MPNLKRTDDPQQVSDREMALAKATQTLRAGAQIGEIFAPEYQPYFIKIVQDGFAKRSAEDRKAIMRDVKANLIVDILRDVVPTIPS